MVTILKYVFLGLLVYIIIIPVLEQLAVLICQGLEIIKGKLLYISTKIQNDIDDLTKDDEKEPQSYVHAIGFTVPSEEYYEEEEDEDDE